LTSKLGRRQGTFPARLVRAFEGLDEIHGQFFNAPTSRECHAHKSDVVEDISDAGSAKVNKVELIDVFL
jgi:hypothetical protein